MACSCLLPSIADFGSVRDLALRLIEAVVETVAESGG